MIWEDTEVKAFLQDRGDDFQWNPFSNPNIPIGGEPFFNEPVAASILGVYKSNVGTAKELMRIIQLTPEAIGIFSQLLNDMFHDHHFEPMEQPNRKGRPSKNGADKVKKAEDFHMKHGVSDTRDETGFDVLATGDGYMWHGQPISIGRISEIAFKTFEKFSKFYEGMEVKSNIVTFPSGRTIEIKASEYFDEDSKDVRIQHVASTTMEPLFTHQEVYGFKQAVGTTTVIDEQTFKRVTTNTGNSGLTERIWPVEEIMHFKFMSIDGKVWGFTPAQALLPVFTTLQLIKDNLGHFFDNAGMPNKAYIFKIMFQFLKKFKKIISAIIRSKPYNPWSTAGREKACM